MQITEFINLIDMSKDKVKKVLTQQVKDKKIKLKDARRAMKGIQAEEKMKRGG